MGSHTLDAWRGRRICQWSVLTLGVPWAMGMPVAPFIFSGHCADPWQGNAFRPFAVGYNWPAVPNIDCLVNAPKSCRMEQAKKSCLSS